MSGTEGKVQRTPIIAWFLRPFCGDGFYTDGALPVRESGSRVGSGWA